MRTARSFTVSPNLEGREPGPGGVCSWVGGLLFGGCLVLVRGGLPLGGAWSRGVVSQHALSQTPPVNRMTNRCNILPCPKLRLRAIITSWFSSGQVKFEVTHPDGQVGVNSSVIHCYDQNKVYQPVSVKQVACQKGKGGVFCKFFINKISKCFTCRTRVGFFLEMLLLT